MLYDLFGTFSLEDNRPRRMQFDVSNVLFICQRASGQRRRKAYAKRYPLQ